MQRCLPGSDLAKENDYTAILLDIKMPNMDGIEFLEALRKQKADVPVVLMTGYPSIPNAASAIRLGASDYVTKPFTPEEISQAVHRLMQHGEPERPRRPPRPSRPRTTEASATGTRRGSSPATGGDPAPGPCWPTGVDGVKRIGCRGSAKWSTRACRWPPSRWRAGRREICPRRSPAWWWP